MPCPRSCAPMSGARAAAVLVARLCSAATPLAHSVVYYTLLAQRNIAATPISGPSPGLGCCQSWLLGASHRAGVPCLRMSSAQLGRARTCGRGRNACLLCARRVGDRVLARLAPKRAARWREERKVTNKQLPNCVSCRGVCPDTAAARLLVVLVSPHLRSPRCRCLAALAPVSWPGKRECHGRQCSAACPHQPEPVGAMHQEHAW